MNEVTVLVTIGRRFQYDLGSAAASMMGPLPEHVHEAGSRGVVLDDDDVVQLAHIHVEPERVVVRLGLILLAAVVVIQLFQLFIHGCQA